MSIGQVCPETSEVPREYTGHPEGGLEPPHSRQQVVFAPKTADAPVRLTSFTALSTYVSLTECQLAHPRALGTKGHQPP